MTDVAAMTAEEFRTRLADELLATGAVTDPMVDAAVRAVPREAFVPEGTCLHDAYAAGQVVITQRATGGRTTSCLSAPWLSLSTLFVLLWTSGRQQRRLSLSH